MNSKISASLLALVACVLASASFVAFGHDFKDIHGYSYSKSMMEVKHLQPLTQCIHFSIRIMHQLAEYENIYAQMSEYTPNIDLESYYLLDALKKPENGFQTKEMSPRLFLGVTNFIDSCVSRLTPPQIDDDENEFALIPHFFFSKAMMEVRHLQGKNQCVNFAIRLMHHLADRKPAYNKMSVHVEGIDRISGDVMKALKKPNGIRTEDMRAKFKNELLTFVNTCDSLLNH